MTPRAEITIEVNGRDRTLVVETRTTLLDALREECHLTGTRGSCEEGVCGSCTVLVDGEPVHACTLFAVQARGTSVTTVEGLAAGDTLHPLQRAFADWDAVGCGACTPGFLMLAAGAFLRETALDEAALEDLAATNLCRCGAGARILGALRAAQDAIRNAP
jgi:carbon-monoxide dehydrogenase small subunit